MEVSKFKIQVEPDNCTGCLQCQLNCSFGYTKIFNSSAARIIINVSGPDCSISFTDQCNECGICADHCFYGALQKIEREAGS